MINKDDKKSSMFENLGLSKGVLKGIREAGFSQPSPIQEQAIPVILEKKDIIAQAQTGTGKTAAFALPIIEMLKNNQGIEALVITPTRELAMQISDEVYKLGKFVKTRTVCVYGGQSIKKQCELIEKNPQVMIATPGRLLDHLKNQRIKNFNPRFVVLDESDEMLDMGFLDTIEEIFNYLPQQVQILLFSATMPTAIKRLADRILQDPVHIKITPTNVTNVDIAQRYYMINENERSEAVIRLLDTENIHKCIIFTRTKKEADDLHVLLCSRGYKSKALHGDMDQRDRRSAILAFKEKKYNILVATDVASRGLDISDVSHVFNYHIPLNSEIYVHRIGRTGRAGKKGVAITLVTPLEYKDLKKIQNDVGSDLELYEIPQDKFLSKSTIQEILKTKIDDKAFEIYEELKNHADASQITLKLISIYLKQKHIGLKKQDLDALEKNIKVQEQKKSPLTHQKSRRRHSQDRKSENRRNKRKSNKEYR
ncbi:ATP-dependent helicase [Helicobacter anseris]|uniref:ATP-dependent helicase n=1 Tax=Helicobacter anseris TaxID=375926 RepID=A0A3D8JBF0_9HELI|nr:DEAD/DEAH box helicase [Helicobacter anseris]RDU74485.1 ATP-dependent helicase [Helicobacter anseris]